MLKIGFIWYWDRASEISPNWRDGYTACVEEIGKTHDIDVFMDEQVPSPDDDYDFIWLWADPNCPFLDELPKYHCRKGVSLTTMPLEPTKLKNADVIYVESQPVYEQCRAWGLRTIKAFGTDSEFFSPDPTVEKDIDFFYPATFSPWKRQSEIAYLGNKLWCVGTVQPDGMEEYHACEDTNVNMETGYFPAVKIRDMYRRTKQIIIPAVHGSERTVLEAMSMNIPVEITHPDINKKTASYAKEYLDSGCKTSREFVLANYSEKVFAQNILKGIKND